MAVATYTTDLQVFNDFETSATFSEFTNWTGGRTQALDTDYPIQGNQHSSAILATASQGSTAVDYGSNVSWTSGWAFFVWHIFLAPAAIDTKANGGIVLLVGSATSAYHQFNVGGSDVDPYPYGGWVNLVADPEVTPTTTVGSVTGYRWVGVGNKSIAAVAKGSPQGVDVIRYGRGELRIAGGDSANGYATFASAAVANDANTARWGLLRAIAGGYQWKGLMYFGYGAATEFTDSDTSIVVANTEFVQSSFNRIEIHNTSSIINWSNISITALGTVSKGQLEVIDDAEFNDTGGAYTGMDTFIYKSNTTITGKTYRNCGKITLNGAIFTGCLIDKTTASSAVLAGSSVSNISNCDFVSDGSSHAIELTGGTSFTLNGLSFTGYAAYSAGGTSTGNEAIYVNISSGDVTIYADAQVSYRTAGANVTIVAGAVNFTATVTDVSGSPISGAAVAMYAKDGTGGLPYQETIAITGNGTTATVAHTGHGMATGDKVLISEAASGYEGFQGVHTITVTGADAYTFSSTTTGTSIAAKATWCALFGTTDGNGEVSSSRVFSSNQPVSGWARKSSGSPYYKSGPMSGTINTSTGGSFTALLLSDE